MRKTKYVGSGGLAFEEEKDMRKLEKLAAEGWMVERFFLLGYILKKEEPQHRIFEIDYRKDPDEEYFSYFRGAGWEHVTSQSNYIHLFTATPGTTPLYTDTSTKVDKYKAEQQMTGKVALPLLLIEVILFVLGLGEFSFLSSLLSSIIMTIAIILLVPLVFLGLPWIAYTYRLIKLTTSK
ncbi:DUF2812 domain-containing protein [Salimicrobium sp. PL1-032A]|uniref:DUF2812 domain-containing protein n=1 Tax=Salimicrobium sp. PL1-032A TaxID=3095364 RepID=UPI003260B99F